MKVIGAIGQNGSGKDEVLKYLYTRYGIPFRSTGDMVREIASREGLEPTRENLQKISERYFQEYGKGYFVKLLAEKLKQTGEKIVGISGIRSLDDILILRNIFNKDFVLINVFISDSQVRYQRMNLRGEERDPHSYEQFLRNDEIEEQIFHLKKAEALADYALNNDGNLDDLHKEIDKLVIVKSLLKI